MDVAKAEKRITVAYADTLTSLFENMARVVEVNQPIIETFYGYGRLIQMFVILQRECDLEVKELIKEFQRNRHIDKRTVQINDYIKSSNQTPSTAMGHFRKSSGSSQDKLNPKDIDALIGEITVIHSRAELYQRFMRRKILVCMSTGLCERRIEGGFCTFAD